MSDIQATKHLDAAAALIRAGYCLEANAQDANRRACPVMAPEAVAWSLYGALLRATGGDDFRCQTSTAFELVVRCLRDFHSLRPNEIGWSGVIVLYEKQQVVIREKDGPVGPQGGDTYALLSHEGGHPAVQGVHHPPWGGTPMPR